MFIIDVNGETGNVSIPEGRDRDWITGKFKLCDDSGAKTCLNLLKKAFTEQIDYPIHKDKTINFYDWIETNIVTLISSEWGVVNSVEDITDFFFRKYSNKSLFYQERFH
jgi:hypothetical protein